MKMLGRKRTLDCGYICRCSADGRDGKRHIVRRNKRREKINWKREVDSTTQD